MVRTLIQFGLEGGYLSAFQAGRVEQLPHQLQFHSHSYSRFSVSANASSGRTSASYLFSRVRTAVIISSGLALSGGCAQLSQPRLQQG